MREAKRRLLDKFYSWIGGEDAERLAKLLDEDPALMAKRKEAWKRLELLRKAREEIEQVGWSH